MSDDETTEGGRSLSGQTVTPTPSLLVSPSLGSLEFSPDPAEGPDPLALAFAQDVDDSHDSAVESAHLRLHRSIKALPDRFALPCWGGSLPVGWWTSDERWERETAAERCVECPVVVDCRAAGAAGKGEPAGVWGGVDRVPRPAKPGRKPKC